MKKLKGRILPIRIYGDKTLRLVSRPIEKITPEISQFIADLTATMYLKDGVGLAAPQVGKAWRIFVVDPFWFQEGKEKKPLVLINPEFKQFEGIVSREEGCLSLPDIFSRVTRPEKVVIEGYNENWEPVRYEADGLFARSLQHEFDHLDGILFIDRIPRFKKIALASQLKQLSRHTNNQGVNIGPDEP